MLTRFRPLAAELRVDEILKTAGVHNFDRAAIDLECANDQLVFFHEMQHDVALTETNYGVILGMFRLACDRAHTPEIRDAFTRWMAELVRCSAETLEIHATYLSIKHLPSTAIEHAYADLPAEYRRYYDTLSTVIDPLFPSTFLQFAIGKTFCEIAFSSRLIDALVEWTPAAPPGVGAADAPDVRLKTLIEHSPPDLERLRNDFRQGISGASFAESLGPGFDILREEDWLALPARIASELDAWILRVIRTRLYPLATSLFPCSMPEEWLAQHARLAEHLNTYLSRGLAVQYSETGTRAHREGRTVISNPAVMRPRRLPVDDPSSLFFYGNEPGERCRYDSVVFVGGGPTESEAKTTPSEWRVFQRIDKQWRAFAISHDDFLRTCRLQMIIASSGMPWPFVGDIVAGIWVDQTEVFAQPMQDISEAYTLKSLRVAPQRVTWYAGGDFYAFYSYLVSLGGLRASWTNPYGEELQLPPDEFQTLSERPLGESEPFFRRQLLAPMWFYFKSPRFYGSFVRMMPAGTDFRFIGKHVQVGRVEVIPRPEAEELWPSVLNLSAPLYASWSSL